MKLEFCGQVFFSKNTHIKFHENLASGSCSRRTDMTKLMVAFRNFSNAPKNCIEKPCIPRMSRDFGWPVLHFPAFPSMEEKVFFNAVVSVSETVFRLQLNVLFIAQRLATKVFITMQVLQHCGWISFWSCCHDSLDVSLLATGRLSRADTNTLSRGLPAHVT